MFFVPKELPDNSTHFFPSQSELVFFVVLGILSSQNICFGCFLLIKKIQVSISCSKYRYEVFVCLFDLILHAPSTIFKLYRDRSCWVEPVLS